MRLLVWIVTIPTVGVIIFGMLQPIIWKEVYQTDPPALVTDLSVILTLVLGLLSVGIAAFGVGTFVILRQEITKHALATTGATIQAHVARAIASDFGDAGFACWEQREEYRKSIYLQELATIQLNEAIRQSERGLHYIRSIGEPEPQDEGINCRLLNNLAYYLAVRKNPEDRGRALAVVTHLEKWILSYPTDAPRWDDTIEFITKQYP